jgi:hypothetical protein
MHQHWSSPNKAILQTHDPRDEAAQQPVKTLTKKRFCYV